MDRQELLYQGAAILPGDDTPTPRIELWASGLTVIAFEAGGGLTPVARLHHVDLSLNGEGYLVVAGDEGTISTVQHPQPQGHWLGYTAQFPDGTEWAGATFQWSNVGVTITAPGHRLDLLGARSFVSGSRRFVAPFNSDGSDEIEALPPKRAACGGCKQTGG